MSTQTVQPITQAPPHDPDASFFDIQRSDAGNARRLLEAHGLDICYHAERNEWFLWDGKRWAVDSKGRKMAGKMKAVLQELRNESLAIMLELTTPTNGCGEELTAEQKNIVEAQIKNAKQDYKWSIRSESDRQVNGAVRQAASEAAVKVVHECDFDASPSLFNVQNGTYDLETNSLREHRREDYITKLAPVNFDPEATCDRFNAFLCEIFPENQDLIDYVQRLLGYCLSGWTTERILPFLIGQGSNGKSVLCNVMLRGVFGKEQDGYGMESSFTTFTTGRYSAPDKPRNDLIRMQGKRFVTASESDDPHVKLDTALLKRISGNDDMSVRANFRQEIEFTPQAKVLLRMNNEPRILDDTDATWERVKRINFRRQFTEGQKDPELTAKLLAESAGIFNWLLEGWRLVLTARRNGEVALPEPDEVRTATEEYRQEQSQVARFFAESYEVAQGECAPISAADIYDNYRRWADKQGEHFKKSHTSFGVELSRQLSQYKTVAKKQHGEKRQLFWFGIQPITERRAQGVGDDDPQADIPF
jgi:putative DNA primase/helicase